MSTATASLLALGRAALPRPCRSAPAGAAAVVVCQQQGAAPAPHERGVASRRAMLALGAALVPALAASRALAFIPGIPGIADDDDIE